MLKISESFREVWCNSMENSLELYLLAEACFSLYFFKCFVTELLNIEQNDGAGKAVLRVYQGLIFLLQSIMDKEPAFTQLFPF